MTILIFFEIYRVGYI